MALKRKARIAAAPDREKGRYKVSVQVGVDIGVSYGEVMVHIFQIMDMVVRTLHATDIASDMLEPKKSRPIK